MFGALGLWSLRFPTEGIYMGHPWISTAKNAEIYGAGLARQCIRARLRQQGLKPPKPKVGGLSSTSVPDCLLIASVSFRILGVYDPGSGFGFWFMFEVLGVSKPPKTPKPCPLTPLRKGLNL